jgi:hypothetical protein
VLLVLVAVIAAIPRRRASCREETVSSVEHRSGAPLVCCHPRPGGERVGADALTGESGPCAEACQGQCGRAWCGRHDHGGACSVAAGTLGGGPAGLVARVWPGMIHRSGVAGCLAYPRSVA